MFITRIDKDTGERQKIRYIYTANGILIGERDSGGDSQQDTILLLDLSFKGYTTDLEDSIDRIEDNRIYLKDGGYQDLELDGDRVLRVEGFSEDGTSIVDIEFNEWGQTESLTIFDEQGEESMKIRTTYETIGLDESCKRRYHERSWRSGYRERGKSVSSWRWRCGWCYP